MASILFLCTGNSCRSQMAEGWAKFLWQGQHDVYSAGLKAHGLNPYAVRVMKEAGVDISQQKSQVIDDVPWQSMDYVTTVCGHADEHCPSLPVKAKKIHHPFDDPPRLAQDLTDEEEILFVYRRVRDEIRDFLDGWEGMKQ
ncbi:arsenate reductase ArsC [Pseudobacteriovorax antillogorgiicola]|uniref:Arsenate reductase n=1 Tax=Pseudobacteriovorax antillogorgiicola TaxID=1513793 RepID=A0A1Y6CU14_9BACT|nr:arsenate reductase ArsC [Pseudobacteriovorax antillogorgiicola]TCS44579.1 protein tyrosine phosphatase [Pseudobacteriovorax antillogorgiicola]SMF78013.1 arsenate reductase [Pseudobacteriovorax antillogorgiicola]